MAIKKVYLRDKASDTDCLFIGKEMFIAGEITTIDSMRWTEITQFIRVDTSNDKIFYVPRENIAIIEDD